MKVGLFFILISFLLAGCSSFGPKKPEASVVMTMKTDMYPESITRSEYYERMALSYFQEKQNQKALEYFKLSLIHNPYSVSALIGLADVYMADKRHLLALISLQDAQTIEPLNYDVMKRVGDLYLDAGIYSKAREVYNTMLSHNNKNEQALWAVFYIFKLERKYEDALLTLAKIPLTKDNDFKIAYEKSIAYKMQQDIALYDHFLAEAIKLNPRYREAVLEFSRRSYELNKFKRASDVLLNYSDTNAFDFEVSQHLAFAAAQAENYKIAIREYNKQIVLSGTNSAEIELKKAHSYFLLGELDTAEKLYLKLAVQDFSDEARFYLGQIYFSKNKYEDAAFVLGQIPSFSDFYGDAMVKLSLYYKYNGDEDKAINILHTAFTLRSDDLEIYKAYADFLIEDKKYVEAVALVEKAINFFPKNEDLRLKMAYLHFRLNNQKSFKKHIKAALKINPQSTEAYAMLSELWYLKNRDVDETMHFAKKATELKSNNKNVKPIMAWSLMQKNRSTEAVAIFEEYYEENPNESFFARSLSQVYRSGGVKQKSRMLAEAAEKLELNDSLKSRFIFKDTTPTVNSENFKENKTRLPASPENQE
jgi:tetratricopeptide (TPR) repeat protein